MIKTVASVVGGGIYPREKNGPSFSLQIQKLCQVHFQRYGITAGGIVFSFFSHLHKKEAYENRCKYLDQG
jgi:hypothetical protein